MGTSGDRKTYPALQYLEMFSFSLQNKKHGGRYLTLSPAGHELPAPLGLCNVLSIVILRRIPSYYPLPLTLRTDTPNTCHHCSKCSFFSVLLISALKLGSQQVDQTHSEGRNVL